MGCCSSKNADSKANRITRWRSTGIVALRDSKLKTFPDEVLNIERSVRTLDLTHNKIVDIPMDINKLLNMQRLVLADNLIQHLPTNLGKLQSLKVMTLDGNRISSLPDEFGQLVRLERFSISRNSLEYLPETIGSLRNLQLLNVSNNKLKSLPESIGSCFSLEELQANDNLIEDLPDSICNLIHLKSLCLDDNNVNQIPPNILKDCKALQNISLHGNPISMDQFQQKETTNSDKDGPSSTTSDPVTSSAVVQSSGEGSSLQITNHKLNGKNFLQWSQSVLMVIRGRGKIGYITGEVRRPNTTDPTYEKWKLNNSIVMAWMINSMELHINRTYLVLRTAKAIWDVVRENYSDLENASQVFEIKNKLKDSRQGNLDITERHLGRTRVTLKAT